MILWEIVSAEVPYFGMTSYQIIGIVSDCRKILDVPKNCNSILQKLIKNCIAYDPKDRTNFDVIIENLGKCIKRSQNHGKINVDKLDFISDELYNFLC